MMMKNSNFNTLEKSQELLKESLKIVKHKRQLYGNSWKVFRATSLTDQIYIKFKRTRQIEESGENNVGDSVIEDYYGIINYSIFYIMEYLHHNSENYDIESTYQEVSEHCLQVMEMKNKDYGEIWKDLKKSTLTDLCLVKILRIKELEIDIKNNLLNLLDNYMDIINYSLFSIFKVNSPLADD